MSAENHLVSIERRLAGYECMIESMSRTLTPDDPALIEIKRGLEMARTEWVFWIQRKVEVHAELGSTRSGARG